MAKRRALLIGVPEYNDPTIISFPEVVRRDVDELEKSLRSSGYQEVKIKGLDKTYESTRTQIIDELERFFAGATAGDTLIVLSLRTRTSSRWPRLPGSNGSGSARSCQIRRVLRSH
jgi:hypothetical protein